VSERAFPNLVNPTSDKRVTCQSSRNGASVIWIVVHDTEGANIPHSSRDLFGLFNFFDRQSTQASAHAGCDNDGNSIRMVNDDRKAWSCVHFNPITLNLEIVHKQGEPYTDACYNEAARWLALWSRRFNIPLVKGTLGKSPRKGVVTHRDLGALGGGHSDPIPPFDMTRLKGRAKHYVKLQDKVAASD
jgi:N-acetyl-anhydromuramyl-L-alanine amidase AmpD